jgi:hypothetical protein
MSRTKTCNGCGKKRKLSEQHNTLLCNECSRLASALSENPELLTKLGSLINKPLPDSSTTDIDIPEVLDAVRYRTRDRDMNTWYVSVSEQDGNPVEIFASTAFDKDHLLQSRISNLTTITRLISLILRNVFLREQLTLEKVLTQLRRSSRQRNDLPEMLSRVLENYSQEASSKEEDSDWL